MDKKEWISSKIKELMEEGKDKDQSEAMAYSMYKDKYEDGGCKSMKKSQFSKLRKKLKEKK